MARKKWLGGSSVVALGVGCAMLMQVSEAEAICNPTAPVNDATVVCSGVTTNQNRVEGYGTGGEHGLKINVQSGASVTGDGLGFDLGGSNTINNSGNISGGDGGIFTGVNGDTGPSTIFNSGTITSSNFAIFFNSNSVGNTLTLDTTSVINGKVLGAGSDILQLGGTGNRSFNVSDIGANQQYQGFSTFNKIGASTWTLTGTGAQNWNISQGFLVGDTNSLQGSHTIADGAELIFDQSAVGTGTYAGSISGAGEVSVRGGGELIMKGKNIYTGATGVDGTLVVDGSLASAVFVTGSGTLAGNGSVGKTLIQGGTLSPGHNGIGTLTVNGDLAFTTGSTYLFGVSGFSSGRTNVTGTATLTGATARAVFAGGIFNNHFTVLSAQGGLNGTTFADFQTNNSAITAKLSYTNTDVILNLTSGFSLLGGLTGLTRNQTVVASALDNALNNGGNTLAGLLNLSNAQLPAAFDALSGEGTSATQETAFGASRGFTAMMMQQGAFWKSGAGEDTNGVTYGAAR
ncbi:MAG TPA: hypothetical protein VGJ56_29155, partial [Reyranella sp.]